MLAPFLSTERHLWPRRWGLETNTRTFGIDFYLDTKRSLVIGPHRRSSCRKISLLSAQSLRSISRLPICIDIFSPRDVFYTKYEVSFKLEPYPKTVGDAVEQIGGCCSHLVNAAVVELSVLSTMRRESGGLCAHVISDRKWPLKKRLVICNMLPERSKVT